MTRLSKPKLCRRTAFVTPYGIGTPLLAALYPFSFVLGALTLQVFETLANRV